MESLASGWSDDQISGGLAVWQLDAHAVRNSIELTHGSICTADVGHSRSASGLGGLSISGRFAAQTRTAPETRPVLTANGTVADRADGPSRCHCLRVSLEGMVWILVD